MGAETSSPKTAKEAREAARHPVFEKAELARIAARHGYKRGQAVQVYMESSSSWTAARIAEIANFTIMVQSCGGQVASGEVWEVPFQRLQPFFEEGDIVQARSISRGFWVAARVTKCELGGRTHLEYCGINGRVVATKSVPIEQLKFWVRPGYHVGQIVEIRGGGGRDIPVPGIVTAVSKAGVVSVAFTYDGEACEKDVSPLEAETELRPGAVVGDILQVWSDSQACAVDAEVAEIHSDGRLKVTYDTLDGCVSCTKDVSLAVLSAAAQQHRKRVCLDLEPEVQEMTLNILAYDAEDLATARRRRVPDGCLAGPGSQLQFHDKCNCKKCKILRGYRVKPDLEMITHDVAILEKEIMKLQYEEEPVWAATFNAKQPRASLEDLLVRAKKLGDHLDNLQPRLDGKNAATAGQELEARQNALKKHIEMLEATCACMLQN
mmetsp:Transcript_23396/g.54409  ORF Transcript_23396/g.54409 Transcript_23396/m.54409 type:complete len:436 (-) Transcript_23396:79-1386(-)